MKIKNIISIVLLALAMTACSKEPSTLTVINSYPIMYNLDSDGMPTLICPYSANVFFGQDIILTVGPNTKIKRKLEPSMLHCSKHLQVDLFNLTTQQLEFSPFSDERVTFKPGLSYTLTIDSVGSHLTSVPNDF